MDRTLLWGNTFRITPVILTISASRPTRRPPGLGGTQLLFIFFALLALLTGGCLVYYFSRRNVRPIIELGQELQTAVEVQKNLQEVVDSQRPIICTSYVRQLLSGTATSEDEVTYMENYLGIADSSYYNVLYIVYYNNFGDNTEITLPRRRGIHGRTGK